jgi:hypothetical protein
MKGATLLFGGVAFAAICLYLGFRVLGGTQEGPTVAAASPASPSQPWDALLGTPGGTAVLESTQRMETADQYEKPGSLASAVPAEASGPQPDSESPLSELDQAKLQYQAMGLRDLQLEYLQLKGEFDVLSIEAYNTEWSAGRHQPLEGKPLDNGMKRFTLLGGERDDGLLRSARMGAFAGSTGCEEVSLDPEVYPEVYRLQSLMQLISSQIHLRKGGTQDLQFTPVGSTASAH